MNQHISDIQNNLSIIKRDLIEIETDTTIIKSDLKAINQSMTQVVNDSRWIKVKILSAIFPATTYLLVGILIYQVL